MIRNEGVRIAPWLRSMLLASVLNLGMPDARMRPRGDRFYRPPRGRAFESPAQWALSATIVAEAEVGTGCHWLGLDVPSTATACGVIVGATGTHADLW